MTSIEYSNAKCEIESADLIGCLGHLGLMPLGRLHPRTVDIIIAPLCNGFNITSKFSLRLVNLLQSLLYIFFRAVVSAFSNRSALSCSLRLFDLQIRSIKSGRVVPQGLSPLLLWSHGLAEIWVPSSLLFLSDSWLNALVELYWIFDDSGGGQYVIWIIWLTLLMRWNLCYFHHDCIGYQARVASCPPSKCILHVIVRRVVIEYGKRIQTAATLDRCFVIQWLVQLVHRVHTSVVSSANKTGLRHCLADIMLLLRSPRNI